MLVPCRAVVGLGVINFGLGVMSVEEDGRDEGVCFHLCFGVRPCASAAACAFGDEADPAVSSSVLCSNLVSKLVSGGV